MLCPHFSSYPIICLNFLFDPFSWSCCLVITLFYLQTLLFCSFISVPLCNLILLLLLLLHYLLKSFLECQCELFKILCSRTISVYSRSGCLCFVSQSGPFMLRVFAPSRRCLCLGPRPWFIFLGSGVGLLTAESESWVFLPWSGHRPAGFISRRWGSLKCQHLSYTKTSLQLPSHSLCFLKFIR